MWIMHFLHHLREGGTAGFVMATGELSNGETARLAVRKALVDGDYVDCVVQLSGQLFANTQIPCALWFLSKNRGGTKGYRKRKGEVLFIDGRKLGMLIEGSRKQKALSAEEVERIAAVYREFKRERSPETVPGFAAVATTAEIAGHRYALTPGRYVGNEEALDEDEPFEERFPALLKRLDEQLLRSHELGSQVRTVLRELTDA
jgi:type I restriction enzyme M protein